MSTLFSAPSPSTDHDAHIRLLNIDYRRATEFVMRVECCEAEDIATMDRNEHQFYENHIYHPDRLNATKKIATVQWLLDNSLGHHALLSRLLPAYCEGLSSEQQTTLLDKVKVSVDAVASYSYYRQYADKLNNTIEDIKNPPAGATPAP